MALVWPPLWASIPTTHSDQHQPRHCDGFLLPSQCWAFSKSAPGWLFASSAIPLVGLSTIPTKNLLATSGAVPPNGRMQTAIMDTVPLN